jgi:hypothetical protein
MGVPRTLGSVAVGALPPTPVFTGPVTAAVSFSIVNGVATIVLGAALPLNGYNGPNGYPTSNSATGSRFDIAGPGAGSGGPAGGQQVTLWGFTTATYFNGKTVSVTSNNPQAKSFSFNIAGGGVPFNLGSTADAGNTAPIPVQRYRAVRLECSQSIGTDIIYVGDLNVSSSRYVAALSLAGQLSVEIAGENIPADRIFITGTSSADSCQISLIY